MKHVVVVLLALVCACRKAPEKSAAPIACRGNDACAANEWCTFKPALCGKGKTAGVCTAKSKCDTAYSPVCGCDGAVYDNECEAHAHGVDLAAYGGCKGLVKDWIACGPRFCDARTTYCEIVLSDVFELPSDYACRPLPSACLPKENPTCSCFPQGTRCLSFCGPLDSAGISGFHLTCRL